MMIEISDSEKKRAVNIIWNSAGSYAFTPDFKAYTKQGSADLYFNCVIGAVRHCYDYAQIEKLLLSIQQHERSDEMEGLIWLGLENAVYLREKGNRPVLEELRQAYAEDYLRIFSKPDDYLLYDSVAYAHWQRALNGNTSLKGADLQLLNELEFSPELSTEELVSAAREFLRKWFLFTGEQKRKKLIGIRRSAAVKRKGDSYRRFFGGFADHPDNIYNSAKPAEQEKSLQFITKLSAAELRDFIRFKYGAPCYSDADISAFERNLCVGNHEDCHLHFTKGEPYQGTVNNAFEALHKQQEAAQAQRNRDYYNKNLAVNRAAAERLASAIRNSILLYLQYSEVKAHNGNLMASKVWRAEKLNDSQVFSKPERGDAGDISVDILLDASVSQKDRQETVSNQGYIIAEALTKCEIPCRVMSFCSMTGYTIMRVYRDYTETGANRKIFDYVSNGCNRDGLAIKTAAEMMKSSPYENKLLIILSDVKPNDVVKIRKDNGEYENYSEAEAVTDTALEVRRARAAGISVICVFTGTDEDLPSASTVYGRDFTRITSIGMLADTVGKLILNTIRGI